MRCDPKLGLCLSLPELKGALQPIARVRPIFDWVTSWGMAFAIIPDFSLP